MAPRGLPPGAIGRIWQPMLHLTKLCVGIRDIAHLAEVQAARQAAGVALRHLTLSMPRRAEEVLEGGSLYWVIAGAMVVRQRLTGIVPATREDGSNGTALMLDPVLVAVAARPTRPFQGWRYLAPEAAPPDLANRTPGRGRAARELAALPAALRRELESLCLL